MILFEIDGYSSKSEGLAGHSSVYKFISSRRKPTGISIGKQIIRSSKVLADSGVL